MSELVDRVAKALNLMDGNISMYGEQAMAKRAIKAVAEWGRSNFYSDKPLEDFLDELLSQLEDK